MGYLGMEQASRLVRERLDASGADEAAYAQGLAFVDGLFGAIRRAGHAVTEWRHASPVSAPERMQAIDMDRGELRRWASAYIEGLPAIHQRALDWLLINTLMFAELDGFAAHLSRSMDVEGPGARVNGLTGSRFRSVAKWAAASLAVAAAALAGLPWLAALLVLLIMARQAYVWQRRNRVGELLESMSRAYASVDSISFGWENLWELLRKSRDLGAVWDPEVYRIVELRMDANERAAQVRHTLAGAA